MKIRKLRVRVKHIKSVWSTKKATFQRGDAVGSGWGCGLRTRELTVGFQGRRE